MKTTKQVDFDKRALKRYGILYPIPLKKHKSQKKGKERKS